jgi:mRNA-degrading endonuclease RelE of RelBE toxin-antitoxin system
MSSGLEIATPRGWMMTQQIKVVFDATHFPKALENLSNAQKQALCRLIEDLAQPIPPARYHYEQVHGNPDWRSVRLDNSSGYRVIFYEDDGYRVLCYVAPHDDAYRWARRVKPQFNDYSEFVVAGLLLREGLEQPTTEVETVPEVDLARYPFAAYDLTELVKLGAPPEEVKTLKALERDELEARLTELRQDERITEPAYERLYLLLSGEPIDKLLPPAQVDRTVEEAFKEAIRRGTLWQPQDWEELENYLQYPWERWLVFLNSTQRDAAQRSFSGPARVTGGPGTGKTIVALHRAKALLARYPNEKILLTTFTRSLANELKRRAEILLVRVPSRLAIQHLDEFVQEQLNSFLPEVRIIYNTDELKSKIKFAQICAQSQRLALSPEFVWQEWEQVVDAWGIHTEQDYLNFERVGRGRALDPNTRQALWPIFVEIRTRLLNALLMTPNQACYELARRFRAKPPFRCVLVDEAQDFGPAQMHLLGSLSPGDQPDNLFFCVDAAQRIYARSVPWKEYGIDVRGRSVRLRINYRNTLEIQQESERVLPEQHQIELARLMDDPEEVKEAIKAGWRPIPCLRNPDHPPVLRRCKSRTDEAEQLLKWVRCCRGDGINYHHIAIVGRTREIVEELVPPLLQQLGLTPCPIGEGRSASEYEINIGTAHAIKGLEFRAIAIVAADLFPLRTQELSDPDTREEFLRRERNLLYTAMTRPRERLYISWVGEAPFLAGASR